MIRFKILILTSLFASLCIFTRLNARQAGKNQTSALSQGSGTLNLKLAQALQNKIRDFIKRFIPDNNFQVIVRTTTDEKAIAAKPYLPHGMSTASLKNRSLRELSFLANSVEVTIWFVKEVNREVAGQILSLLREEADFSKEKGDIVTSKTLNISLNDLDAGAGQLAKQMESVQNEIKKIRNERDEANRNLTILKINFDKALKETALSKEMLKTRDQQYSDIKRQLSELQKIESQLQTEYSSLKQKWEQGSLNKLFSIFGDSLFLSIAGLICALIFVFGLTRSFSAVSTGLKKTSDNLASALSSIANNLTMNNHNDHSGKHPNLHVNEVKNKSISDISQSVPGIEELKIYQSSLRDEIDRLWKEEFESDVVIYIDNLIRKHNKTSHAMIVFEILGQDKSEKVFRRLSKQAKQSVNYFIRNAHYDKPKSVLMIEAGENLKTLLFAEYISKSDSNLNQDIIESLVKLEFDFTIHLFLEIEDIIIPRLLLYLDPEKISEIMKHMHRNHPERFKIMSEKLSDIPEAQGDANQDEAISEKIQQTMMIMQKDVHKPYYQFYREVLEKTGDELSEKIMSELAGKNEGLGQFLRSTVVTFNSLFLLPDPQISTIVGELTNHEVGIILSCIEDEALKKRLLTSFSSRRQEMIMDELEVVSGRPEQQVNSQFRKLKEKVTRSLKKSGLVENLSPKLESSSDEKIA